MNDEYKDRLTREILEQNLMDEITDISDECYVEGIKDGRFIKYYITITDEGWLCRHQEF